MAKTHVSQQAQALGMIPAPSPITKAHKNVTLLYNDHKCAHIYFKIKLSKFFGS